jgi:hypothetical protein
MQIDKCNTTHKQNKKKNHMIISINAETPSAEFDIPL